MMKKILLTFNEPIVAHTGGSKKALCDLANELTLRGHHVTIVHNDTKQGLPFFPLMREVNLVNLNSTRQKKQYPLIKKIVRELTRPFRKTTAPKRTADFAEAFRQIVHQIEPDAIISYHLSNHYFAVQAIGHDRPLIVSHHNAPDYRLLDRPFDQLSSLQRCDCLQLLLPSYEKTVQERLPWQLRKTCAIPNGVAFVEERDLAKPGERKDEYIITMLGRLNKRQKQQDFLIRAFSYLAKEYPQWKVHIYGGAPNPKRYEKDLQTLIHDLQLEDQVILKGITDKPNAVLQASDIFAFPTAFEGFPLALTEAMAHALPCVGLKTTPSVNELIMDGYSGCLSDNDEFDFAQKLRCLMDDPHLRITLGRNGREFVKQFEPKKIWDQWENLIIDTIQQYPQHRTRNLPCWQVPVG